VKASSWKVLAAAGLCLNMLAGCSTETKITSTVELNTTDAGMDAYQWITEPIGDFRKVTVSEALRLFDEKGSGILYLGYPGCPWCERAVPILNEAVNEKKVTVYYICTKDPFDADEFDTLKDDLYDAMPVDADGNRDFYVPMVVGIKKGAITGHHTSLVDDFQINSSEDQMSDAQKKKLKDLYLDIIARTAD
jgi:predicted bacteriocin transport accessory protein